MCIFIISIHLVAAKIVETKVHRILGKDLTVELKKPVQKASLPTGHEQAAILVSNVTGTLSDDLLYLYIDNIIELDGESGDYIISRRDNLQVIITFDISATQPTGGTCTFVCVVCYVLYVDDVVV